MIIDTYYNQQVISWFSIITNCFFYQPTIDNFPTGGAAGTLAAAAGGSPGGTLGQARRFENGKGGKVAGKRLGKW